MEGGTERLEGLSGSNLHAYMPDPAFPQTGTSHQDPSLLPAKLNRFLYTTSADFVSLLFHVLLLLLLGPTIETSVADCQLEPVRTNASLEQS